MYRILLISCLFLFQSQLASAQEMAILQGTVSDSLTQQKLPFASLIVKPINQGFSTDKDGSFFLTLPKGSYTLQISFLGYATHTQKLALTKNKTVDFYLSELSVSVDDVTISAEKSNRNIISNEVGALQLDSKEISQLPTLMGEPDIINAFRLTPGVQGGGEGNTGLYVRGGDAGQNLILLDNMTLYNPSHLLGFFPVFNADIIDNAKIIKGGIPAQYGSKASSVIDISMKEGNSENIAGSGSIGLLSTDATLELPINKGKGSLIISGRRTYLNVMKFAANQFIKSSNNFFSNTDYYFYDGSLKFRYNLGANTRIYLTAFGGKDFYHLSDNEFNVSNKMTWSNSSGAIRLNHVFNPKFFVNIASSKTYYDFDIDAAFDKYSFNLFSAIDDWNNAIDFTYLRRNKFPVKFGAAYTRHVLTPNKINADAGNVIFKNTNQYHSNEFAAYLNADFQINSTFSISGGLRLSLFQHIGPYTHYYRNEVGQLSDSIIYLKNENVKSYLRLDPNLNWVYILNNESSLKGSLSINHQFIHLASVGTVSLPTDVWLPSTQFIPPQQAAQITAGYFKNFMNNGLETSVELYYKNLENQIDFLNGVLDIFDNTKIEDNIIIGSGQAFGAEFFLKKQMGKTTGWLSYTLSKTNRKFEEINNGESFAAKYDRVHDFSLTVNHKLNEKWNISAVFIYATGNAMTLPAGRYLIQGNVANHYTDVNSFRMPAYHRLDVSANYLLKKRGRFESSINFSIYNAYNNANPYFIYFQVEGNIDEYYLSVKPKQVSLFPILPAITYSFKF